MRGSPTLDASAEPRVPLIAPLPRISIQAFCESPSIAAVVNEAMSDRRMDRVHAKVTAGGAPAAVEAYREAPTPNLIIIESAATRADLLTFLEKLSEFCDAGTKVVVLGHLNDIVLYRDLMAQGVSDYLVAPITALDLVKAVSQLYSHPEASPVGRVVAVMGSKGGCGASTVAHNLAWSMARNLDLATVIVDLDLPFGTAGLNFNQDPPQSIAEAVFAPDRIDGNLIDRLLSKCTDKLSLLSAPATLDRLYDLNETSLDAVLDILRASMPCIVLDVPHQWTAWTRRVMMGADEIVVVAGPDLASLRNTKNLLDLLKTTRQNDAAPKLVMNGVGLLKRPEIAMNDFIKAVEVEPIAVIPFDAKLFGTAANNGQMIGEVEAGSRIAETFVELARRVSGRMEVRQPKRTLLSPLMARLNRRKAS